MGYALQALIAAEETWNAADLPDFAECKPLERGWEMLPLTEDFLDGLRGDDEDDRAQPVEGFWKLTTWAHAFALEVSRSGTLAYLEAEVFAGTGGQSGIVWEDAEVTFGPVHSGDGDPEEDAAINRTLRRLGVKHARGQDEFDTLRLDRHASTQDWADWDPSVPDEDEDW